MALQRCLPAVVPTVAPKYLSRYLVGACCEPGCKVLCLVLPSPLPSAAKSPDGKAQTSDLVCTRRILARPELRSSSLAAPQPFLIANCILRLFFGRTLGNPGHHLIAAATPIATMAAPKMSKNQMRRAKKKEQKKAQAEVSIERKPPVLWLPEADLTL